MTEQQIVAMDATILSSLMSCGCMTNLSFNENLTPTGGKSNSLECGSIVHSFLEYYYQSLINKRSKDEAMQTGFDAAKVYIKGCPICKSLPIDHTGTPVCGHKGGDWIGVVNTPENNEKTKIGSNHALDTCLQYLAHYKNDYWTPLAVEHTKSAIIYEAEDIKILWKAKFDLIVDTNQQIIPIDHKTSKQRRDTLKLNNQFKGQCILTNSRNMIVNKIGFQTSLKPAEKFERAMMSYSKDALDEWQNVIVPYWARLLVQHIQKNEWPRNYTHCENKYGFCHFKEICESDRNMRDEVIRVNFVKRRAWDVSND